MVFVWTSFQDFQEKLILKNKENLENLEKKKENLENIEKKILKRKENLFKSWKEKKRKEKKRKEGPQ